jgi:hypothetical protein
VDLTLSLSPGDEGLLSKYAATSASAAATAAAPAGKTRSKGSRSHIKPAAVAEPPLPPSGEEAMTAAEKAAWSGLAASAATTGADDTDADNLPDAASAEALPEGSSQPGGTVRVSWLQAASFTPSVAPTAAPVPSSCRAPFAGLQAYLASLGRAEALASCKWQALRRDTVTAPLSPTAGAAAPAPAPRYMQLTGTTLVDLEILTSRTTV